MSAPLRAQIARWLSSIAFQGKSANAVTALANQSLSDSRDLAFAKECLFGCARHYEKLQWIQQQLLEKPIKAKEKEVSALLLSGLYQLYYLNTPDHAVISETVNAARLLKKDWATRLLNGVLRNAVRRREELTNEAIQPNFAKYELPQWLLKQLKHRWPNQWQAIAEESRVQAPLVLRVNQTHPMAGSACELLEQEGIDIEQHSEIPSAIKLKQARNTQQIPYFDDGLFSVQDLAAQMAAYILPVDSDQHILDACAAPGGKTAHLLETFSTTGMTLTALDNDERRASKILQNLERLKLTADIKVMDANLWQGDCHSILLDAPCSATGVIRRQPDIKIHRKSSDIPQLVTQQKKLLHNLWQQLLPGGHMLYATCSILPEENSHQVEAFLAGNNNASLVTLPSNVTGLGIDTGFGLQLLPCHWHDGFFYALIKKHQ